MELRAAEIKGTPQKKSWIWGFSSAGRNAESSQGAGGHPVFFLAMRKCFFPGTGVQIPVPFDTRGILNSSWVTGKFLKANLRVGILRSLFIYPALFPVLRAHLDIQALTFQAAKLQNPEIMIWGEK